MHRNFFLIVVFLSLFSCMGTVDRLEWALTLAGENRTELEKVLQYYKDDSLKYKAACFLIENMPYHYGYEDARLDSVKAILATAPLGDGYIPDSERKRKWKSFNYKSLPILQDVQRMTAALLIENIEVYGAEMQKMIFVNGYYHIVWVMNLWKVGGRLIMIITILYWILFIRVRISSKLPML